MKRTGITIALICLTATLDAQTHRIDSIKKILSSQTGQKLVNSFNALGNEFSFYWVHSDSSIKYTSLAIREASSIGYNSGKAEALSIRGGVEGRLLGRPAAMEQLAREAIETARGGKDLKVLSLTYYYLGIALSLQGKYPDAEQVFEEARKSAIQAKDKNAIGWSKQGIGFMYFKSGKYWKSFEPLIEAQQIGKELNDSLLVTISLALIARTFNLANDPQKAIDYYHQAFRYAMPFIYLWSHVEDMAYAHLRLKQYDSAQYYQDRNNLYLQTMTPDPIVRKKFMPFSRGYSIEIQLAKKQYDSVLIQVLPTIQRLRESKDVVPYMQSLYILGKVYEAKGNYHESLKYSRKLYQEAKSVSSKRLLKDSYELLSSVFAHLKQGDSAYYYHKLLTVIQDSLETIQYAGRTALYLAASESENKIRLLQKDKEINEQQLALNEKEIQKQAQMKNLFAGGLLVLVLLFGLAVRNIILKRKNEMLRNEHLQSALKRKALELEMQALRAQMNPHFIFNCLSAIDNLIQTNQTDKATTCLSRFAKLLRGVLDSSKNNLVAFQKDFDTLKLYLEMEEFRCNKKFKYELNADAELMESDYKVPPLIIQPFVENAIHHGLLNKQEGSRELKIEAQLKDDHIVYLISDNGVGRKKAGIIKEMNRPNQKSYGIEITKERIQLHNKNEEEDDLVITDLEEGGLSVGTQAMVRINCLQ